MDASALLVFIDDDARFRERVADHFKGNGLFSILTFSSAETFWHTLPELKPAVAFIDIQMPGMTGIELVGLLAEVRPEIHRVMLTNLDSEDAVFQALRNGAGGYVRKSEMDDFAAAASVMMNGGSILTPTVAVRVVQSFRTAANLQERSKLTVRERQLLDLMVQGMTLNKAAVSLGVSLNTARTHIKSVYRKLEVHDKSALFRKARDMGLL
ncbi:MAG: response regulator transcription factor [Spirochaetia bacterium]|nr:response regulator transcription factor [Spirochaetia bacterium]